MSIFTKEQIKQIDKLLYERQRHLLAEIQAQAARNGDQHYADMAGNVADTGDDSVADLLIDLDLATVDRDVNELREIDAAYARMREGTYGICDDCGNEIAFKRLAANPTATRCIACQAQREKVYAHEGRPTL